MFSDFRTGFKMLKYSFRIKWMLAAGILFFCVGIFFFGFFLLSHDNDIGYFYGIVYWTMSGVMLCSTITSLGVSNIVQSSSRKKALHTSVPVCMNLCYYLITYILFLLMGLLIWGMSGQRLQPGDIVMYGLMAALIMVYSVGCLKLFYVAILFLIVVFFPVLWDGAEAICLMSADLPMGAAVCIGLAEILLGAGVQYFLLRLAYHLPVDRAAVTGALRKYL